MSISSSTQAERLEGNGFSQLRQVIAQVGYNDFDKIELATVLAPPPGLRIQIDNMKEPLEADDLIVAQHLTRHKRKITLTGLHNTDILVEDAEQSAGGTYPKGTPINSIDFDEFSVRKADITVTEAEIEYLDELAEGDRVIVSSMNDGQAYVILDRVVMYGGS